MSFEETVHQEIGSLEQGKTHEDLSKLTGKSQEEIKAYQKEHQISELQHKLGGEFASLSSQPETYDPAKLSEKLNAALEKITADFEEKIDPFNRGADMYLQRVQSQLYDSTGKLQLTPDKIREKGMDFALLYEDLIQQGKILTTLQNKRNLIQIVLEKLGSNTPTDSSKAEQKLTELTAQLERLKSFAAPDLDESIKGQFITRVEQIGQNAYNHRKTEIKASSSLNPFQSNMLDEASEKVFGDYLMDFWNSLNANEQALLKGDVTFTVGAKRPSVRVKWWTGTSRVFIEKLPQE